MIPNICQEIKPLFYKYSLKIEKAPFQKKIFQNRLQKKRLIRAAKHYCNLSKI